MCVWRWIKTLYRWFFLMLFKLFIKLWNHVRYGHFHIQELNNRLTTLYIFMNVLSSASYMILCISSAVNVSHPNESEWTRALCRNLYCSYRYILTDIWFFRTEIKLHFNFTVYGTQVYKMTQTLWKSRHYAICDWN
jgi:hypothetical protein